MTDQHKPIKTIMKFDVGADGFLKMIVVLGIAAIIVLMAGLIFLNQFHQEMRQMV